MPSSSLRLESDLVERAKLVGSVYSRSAAKQIEPSLKNYPCSPGEQVLISTQISSNSVLSNTVISVR